MQIDGYAEFIQAIHARFGEPPQSLTEISAGGNNRLFRLHAGGQELLAKFYYRHLGDGRLEREFEAITFSSARGLPVPRAVLANQEHQFGVYTFEPGQPKDGPDVTYADIEQIADFILALHAIPVADTPRNFPLAGGAFHSYQNYIDLMNERMDAFAAALNDPNLHPRAAVFAQKVKAISLVQDLIHQAVASLTPAEIKRSLPKRLLRLSPIDLGPHNILFTNNGVCFIDFEYAGWDEPMRTIAEFAYHQANRGISPELHRHFRDYYLANTKLPDEIINRLPIDDRLMAIIWLTTQLRRLTPERIAGLEFAHPNFDLEYHITATIAKARQRIDELTA